MLEGRRMSVVKALNYKTNQEVDSARAFVLSSKHKR